MDGPAHYCKAEELAEKAAGYPGQGDRQDTAAVWAALAQVHATLAVAAASGQPRLAAPIPKPPPRSAALRPPVLVTRPPATGNTGYSVSSAGRQNSDTRANYARRTYPRDHELLAVTRDKRGPVQLIRQAVTRCLSEGQ